MGFDDWKSAVSLGTMRMSGWGAKMDVDTAHAFLKAGADAGMTLLDTADIYGPYDVEELIGKVFAKDPALRKRFTVLTKAGIHLPCERRPKIARKGYESSREHLVASVDRSLAAMQLDVLDVLLVHRPDPLTPPASVAATFAELLKSKKVRHVGVSNYTSAQLRALVSACAAEKIQIEVNQVEISPVRPDALFDGTVDACMELGVGVMAWSPLGSGSLFSEAPETSPELARSGRVRRALQQIAQKHEVGLDVAAIAWVASSASSPVPVLGTTKLERLQSLAKGLQKLPKLQRDEWFDVYEAFLGREID